MPAASGSMEGGRGTEESNRCNQDESSSVMDYSKSRRCWLGMKILLRYCKKQLGW